MRNYNEPPEPIECNPENYDADRCYYCAWEWYCRQEYEKFVDVRQVKGEQNATQFESTAEKPTKKRRIDGKGH